MAYRQPQVAPASALPAERRGPAFGRFCRGCASVYGLHQLVHAGRAVAGKDHVASPCAHEGERFAEGAPWWEPAVEILPAPPAPPAA